MGSLPDQLTLQLDTAAPHLPSDLRPMLPRAAEQPFDDADWLFEPSWDGLRALARVERGRVRLSDPRGRDVTDRFPELLGLVDAVAGAPAILDGEIVVPGADGTPDPSALERRLRATAGVRRARAAHGTAVYLTDDLLFYEGRSLLREPLARRRRALESALGTWRGAVLVPAVAAEGRSLFDAVAALGLPAVLARRRDSPYLPGVRSDLWRLVRVARRFETVAGGWAPRPDGSVGLLLGAWERAPDGPERLVAVGAAEAAPGSPLTAMLHAAGRRFGSDVTPFARGARAGYRWLRPELVVSVDHEGWSESRLIRPRPVAVRDELDPRSCRLPPGRTPADAVGPSDGAGRPLLALLQRLPLPED
jgi:ATP-dependent DNA ligase